MRILLIEAQTDRFNRINAELTREKFVVERAEVGADALDLLRHYEFDLVLLSLALPDVDGTLLITRMRAAGRTLPVVAISSKNTADLRLKALTAGADDVVEQDIGPAELVARMRAIIRRTRGFSQSTLQVGGLTLDMDQGEVFANGKRIALTPKEFALLRLMALRKNMILTKESILSNLYGGLDEPEVKIVDVFVCKLRRKLADAGLSDLIGTVWGRGYVLRSEQVSQARQPTAEVRDLMLCSS